LSKSIVSNDTRRSVWKLASLDFTPHDPDPLAILVSLFHHKFVIASSDFGCDVCTRLEEGIVEKGDRRQVGSGSVLGVSSVFGVSRTVLGSSGDTSQEGEGIDDLGQHFEKYSRCE
jgi:hypothetical protein